MIAGGKSGAHTKSHLCIHVHQESRKLGLFYKEILCQKKMMHDDDHFSLDWALSPYYN